MLIGQHARRQIVFVPRRHYDYDLRSRSESGFYGVLPLLPHFRAKRLAVRLFAVLYGVVNDDEVCGVAGDTGANASTDEAPCMTGEFKFHRAIDSTDMYIKQRIALALDFLFVAPTEFLCEILVVAGDDYALVRPSSHVPRGQRLGNS